jgi:hypothetical protein
MSTTYLEHILCALNRQLTHVHHVSLYPLSIRQLELGFGMVHILHHIDELWYLHFIKWLVAGNNPLGEKMPEL